MQPAEHESRLIARVVLDGDQHAYATLVHHYQQSIRQYCRRLCRHDFALADDIAQDTFWQAYRKIRQYAGSGSFQSWLFRIAYFQFLQQLRRNKATQELVAEPAIADSSEQLLLQRDLETAIATLNVNERACITLQFSFGYSQQEIAAITDLPLGTVKSHVNRGKQKLTELLHNEQATPINGAA